jgi:hypothetical protein
VALLKGKKEDSSFSEEKEAKRLLVLVVVGRPAGALGGQMCQCDRNVSRS